jgi:O-antigen/teichoic acid export membrane protein
MDKQGFFKHAAVYGLALLLSQAGGLILLPLYTRCLTASDYGVLEILGRMAEVVGTVLLFGGFRQALLTFYQQSDSDAQRRHVFGSTLGLVVLACLAGGLPVLAFAGPVSRWLGGPLAREGATLSATLLRLAVLGILLEPLALIPLTLMQARFESTRFVLVSLSQLVVRVSLCVVLVSWLGWGVSGVLTATALTAALYGAGLCGRELARGWALPDAAQVRALLRFSLPFVPGGLCFFLLHHGDRFFLLHFDRPAAEIGRYALGYKLGMAVTTFSLTPLYMVWGARMYGVARTPEAPAVFGRAFTRILGAYLAVGLALCLFQDEVIAVLAARQYAEYAPAADVVPLIVLACFCQASASLMDAGFYVRRRTGLKLWTTAAATAVMLLLYWQLIPRWGSLGAAWATLAGFAFLAAGTWLVSRRVFPVQYEWRRLGTLLALTLGLWLASRTLPPGGWSVPLKLALWLVWPLVLWYGRLMSPEEKEHLRELVGGLTARLRAALRAIPGQPRGRSILPPPVLLGPPGEDAPQPELPPTDSDRPAA